MPMPTVPNAPPAMPTGNLQSSRPGSKLGGGAPTHGGSKGLTNSPMKTPLGRKVGKR